MLEGLKIFCINDTDTVVGKSISEIKNWYSTEINMEFDEIEIREIKDYNDYFYEELDGLYEAMKELEKAKGKATVTKINGGYFKMVTFKEALEEIGSYEAPLILCSTEY